MFRLLTPLFIASALAGACAVAEDGPAPGDDSERGSLGKADLVGSCETPAGVDFCGGKGSGTCWCDEACVDYGDCCSDAGEVCGIDDGGDDAADDAGDDGEVCGDVLCALFCENGFKTDENGCEVCECQGQFCGGIGAIQCPDNEICVLQGDYPDAGGTCEPAPFCGGFAGIQCPEGLECFDVPGDGCDPPEGADCGGICLPPIDPPPPPPPPSCEGNCGGSAGECWCDDLCTGYGDCCKDYEDVCVDDGPEGIECGDEICGPGHTCVTHVTQVGLQHACEPVPEECSDDVGDCACMGADVCTGVFDSCSDNPDGGLFCSCPVC